MYRQMHVTENMHLAHKIYLCAAYDFYDKQQLLP
jgi:hypothetical protein